MLASELWALTQRQKCEGKYQCHWCSGPCDRGVPHDDLPPIPFIKSKSLAKRPASPWICLGCENFRRKKRTVKFIDGNAWKDCQAATDHSWLLTLNDRGQSDAKAIRRFEDSEAAYRALLKPPRTFTLALLDVPLNGGKAKTENLIHLWTINENKQDWGTGDELAFTLNNVQFSYTIYELTTALSTKDAPPMSPGVQALTNLFGIYPPLEAKKDEPIPDAHNRPEWNLSQRQPRKTAAKSA